MCHGFMEQNDPNAFIRFHNDSLGIHIINWELNG